MREQHDISIRNRLIWHCEALVHPHFLFNALSVISDTALVEHAPQTHEAIGLLSVFLHYSIVNISKAVTLQQETKNLELYFKILQLRFGDRYSYEVILEEDCRNILVPAIILQPVAENMLCHGIGSYRRGGYIRCRISSDAEAVRIEMQDNGIGMTLDQIAHLKSRVSQELESGLSEEIGLLLVYHRLQDFFEGRCGFDIKSIPGKETSIIFTIPAASPSQRESRYEIRRDRDPNGKQENPAVRHAREYIHSHYDKKLFLEDVAQIVYMNPAYLSRLFKQEVGVSFTDYLRKVRIDASKKLLLDGYYNISEIAERTGFGSVKYFSFLFRRETGRTPTEYRNRKP